ncbi:MAG: hypothetical protein EPN23_08570 [Verrucomicrobia bacterium]|nr:MAG: hypothetical protein EPN23_08570 [Verrucomicrobiota bacterium]
MPSPRTLMSATRTGVYGTLAAVFSITDPHALQIVDAIVLGGVLADYATWLVRSLIDLPGDLWHGMYDGVINTIFGMFMFRYVQANSLYDGEALAAGYAAFMLVMLIKIFAYGAAFIRETE